MIPVTATKSVSDLFLSIIFTCFISGVGAPILSANPLQATFQNTIQEKNEPTLPQNFKVIGQTRFSVWFWDIYDVTLKNITGQYQKKGYPIILQLDYLRDIKSKELIEETQKQWQRFDIDQAQQTDWLAQLTKIWPDIQQGDSIQFYIDENGDGHFFHNQQLSGSIKDSEFSYHFLNIWVSPDSAYPKMTKKLIGQT